MIADHATDRNPLVGLVKGDGTGGEGNWVTF